MPDRPHAAGLNFKYMHYVSAARRPPPAHPPRAVCGLCASTPSSLKVETHTQSDDKQVNKASGRSSFHKVVTQDYDSKKTTDWKLAQSKKDKKKLQEKHHPKQPMKQLLRKSKQPWQKPNQKKLQKSRRIPRGKKMPEKEKNITHTH
ncbi:hypothetical protein EVAR_9981_1 [Eumeta japonica]|uniref:Uncharacterized protein n=1 Tax=Eumeta variegata TaxID=151549 RepID=A0A4C1TQZ7_EUMVA|nr:hypothetical protein EVAR_9981_1 [Eumeta japonica]